MQFLNLPSEYTKASNRIQENKDIFNKSRNRDLAPGTNWLTAP